MLLFFTVHQSIPSLTEQDKVDTKLIIKNIEVAGSDKLSESKKSRVVLGALTSNAPRELHVTGCDCDSLGVNGAALRVLKQTNQIVFSCFLKRTDRGRLEADVWLEVLGDLAYQASKWYLADKELR